MKPKTVRRAGGGKVADGPQEPPRTDVCGLRVQGIILTPDGERRVRELVTGDRVITRDSGTAVIRGAESRQVTTRAIRILAGSLGHTRPDRDVTLPAGQPVLIRDWRARAVFGAAAAMMPAHRLIDGEFVTDVGEETMMLVHLRFDMPHVLYVDGMELASDGMAQLRAARAA